MLRKRLLGLTLLLTAAGILFGTTVCLARTEPLYEYIKVEEYDPEDFALLLLPESVFPIEKVIKYEKRLNAGFTFQFEEVTRTFNKGDLLGVEYRVRYQQGQGETYEPLIYSVDYTEADRGIKTSMVSSSWIKAYEFIKNDTEKNALIICWWPHARRLQLFTGRETLVSGPSTGLLKEFPVPDERYAEATRRYELKRFREKEGLENDEKLRDVARMFCSPEAAAIDIMQKHNPLNRPVYIVASAEELPEMENINRLGDGYIKLRKHYVRRFATTFENDMVFLTQWLKGRGIETYYTQVFDDYYTLWFLEDRGDPEMQGALLLRFLPFSTGHGQEIGYFTPVYQSPEAHVWVYRFVPEGVPVRRIDREGARHFGATR